MPQASRLFAAVNARFHGALGWAAYKLGWREVAQRRYERVLALRGPEFVAHVQLGRIAFDRGDYVGWRRELERARHLDPVRFARLRHPLELFEPRLAGTNLDRRLLGGDADQVVDGLRQVDAHGSTPTATSLAPGRPAPDSRSSEGFGNGTDMPLAPDFDPTSAGAGASDGERQEPLSPIPRPTPPDASLTHDDFSSPSERRRFRARRPIEPGEIARCDLADLARRLSG